MSREVRIKLENGAAPLRLATPGSAGYDLAALTKEPIIIEPSSSRLISTGISLELPTGFAATVCSRSGLSIKNGIHVLNSPGIIDSDYRGEVKVILHNTGKSAFQVINGMYIAQLLFLTIPALVLKQEQGLELSQTIRNTNGFGSTGV